MKGVQSLHFRPLAFRAPKHLEWTLMIKQSISEFPPPNKRQCKIISQCIMYLLMKETLYDTITLIDGQVS